MGLRYGALLLAILSVFVAVPAAAAEAPVTMCTVTDKRITELSGLVSDGQRWYAINDGGTKVQVFVLGRDCAVQRVITNSTDPFDVEDLARAADGTLWLSDTGDNNKQRGTVALLALTPQGKVTLYRLTYPDGQHDVEALLLDRTGTPYLITKNPFGDAGIYRPTGALTSPGPTALQRVGSVTIKATDTPGGPVAGFIASVLVTGAASSADGKAIALRTYTDAYLYSAPDGDVLAALKREPVRVPLPNEPQGEAIAFEPDGTLLSAGEGTGQPVRAVRGAASLAAASAESGSGTGSDAAAPGGGGSGGSSGGLASLPGIVLAVVVAGGLVFIGAKIRRRLRR